MTHAYSHRNLWTNHTIPTAGGTEVGDMIILMDVLNGNNSLSTGAFGYTTLGKINFGTTACMEVQYKIANGTDFGSYATTPTNRDSTLMTIRIAKDTFDPAQAPEILQDQDALDPHALPVLSPTWGEHPTLWIAAAGYQDTTAVVPTSYPTDYSDFTDSQGGGTDVSAWVAACSRQATAATIPAGGSGWDWPSASVRLYSSIAIKGT
jgi:hypothetical protein